MIDKHELLVKTPAGISLDAVAPGGTLTIDLGWSPHVQADLTLAPSENARDLRASDRIILHLLQRTGLISFLSDLDYLIADGNTTDLDALLGTGTTTAVIDDMIEAGNYNSPPLPATSRRFDLIITDAPRITPDGVKLQLASDEHELDGTLWFWSTALQITSRTPAGMLGQALAALDAAHVDWTPPSIVNLGLSIQHEMDPITIEAGGLVFDEINRRNTYLRHRLYSPGDGTLLVRPYPWPASEDLEVEVAQGYNLVDWDIRIGGDERFMVSFISPSNPADRALYLETSPGLEESLPPPRTLITAESRPLVDPPTGDIGLPVEVNPASTIIDRQRNLNAPRTVTAISNYTARAGELVNIDIPDMDFLSESIIQAVQFRLGSNLMTITF